MQEIEKEAEIAVIGGGVAGVSTTYYLAKQGKDVILVERREIASEASGANGAAVAVTYFAPSLIEISLGTLAEYEILSKELGRDIEFERTGTITLLEDEEAFRRYRLSCEVHPQWGRIVNTDELHELEPNVIPMKWGAAYWPEFGRVNPLYLVTALADKARELGAKVHEYTRVLDIKVEKGRIGSVITDKGEVKAKYVVNAAGAFAPSIGEMLGMKVPITPKRHQMLVTEELYFVVCNRHMLSSNYRSVVMPSMEGASALKSVPQVRGCFLVNPTKKGNLLLGIAGDFAGMNSGTTLEAIQFIRQKAVEYLPILKEQHVNIIRSYANQYAFTPDGCPILGPVSGIDGFIMNCGFNDDGMCLALMCGKLISQLICFGETGIAIREFSLSRFG